MAVPHVLIVRAPGTNCDAELAYAFERAGARVESIHVQALRIDPNVLQGFQILAFPGGFSYGDDVAAGKILASQLSTFFNDALREFRDAEKLILGVCNGFQTLLKAGLLIPPDEDGPLATLTNNVRGYQDRWITMAATPGKCVWLTGIEQFDAPTAHGEGNFQCRAQWILKGLKETGQVVLHYVDKSGQPTDEFPANPNGSSAGIAGICDASGRVLGLMPHPERNVLPTQHPHWTRNGLQAEGGGAALFRNAVGFFL